MIRQTFTLLVFIILAASCRPESIATSQVCLEVKHHEEFIPNTKIYFKYNDTVFPGYDLDELDKFDAVFQVDENGEGCFRSIPLGNHWIVAHGFDEEWGTGAPIRGSSRISLDVNRYTIDSTIYVQEY